MSSAAKKRITVLQMRNQAQLTQWFWPSMLSVIVLYGTQATPRTMLMFSRMVNEWLYFFERARDANTAVSHRVVATLPFTAITGYDVVMLGFTMVMLLVSAANAYRMQTTEY
jgi:hypothetical protein